MYLCKFGNNPSTGSEDNEAMGMPTESVPKGTCPSIPSGKGEHKKGPCFLEDGAFRKFRGLSRIIPVLHLGPDFRHFVTNFCNLYTKRINVKVKEIFNILKYFNGLGRPFMYARKRIGWRTEPCGTPEETGSFSELIPLITTACFQLFKKSFIRFRVSPLMP